MTSKNKWQKLKIALLLGSVLKDNIVLQTIVDILYFKPHIWVICPLNFITLGHCNSLPVEFLKSVVKCNKKQFFRKIYERKIIFDFLKDSICYMCILDLCSKTFGKASLLKTLSFALITSGLKHNHNQYNNKSQI